MLKKAVILTICILVSMAADYRFLQASRYPGFLDNVCLILLLPTLLLQYILYVPIFSSVLATGFLNGAVLYGFVEIAMRLSKWMRLKFVKRN